MLVGVLAISMAAPYILLSEVEPFAIASWRLLCVSAILFPIAARSLGADWGALGGADRLKFLFSGVCYGAHFALFALAFGYTSKESVVVLIGAQPLMGMAVGRIFLRELVTSSMLIATAISLAGLTVFVWHDYTFDPTHLLGDCMVLAAGFLIVIPYAAGRRLRPKMKLSSYLFGLYLLGGISCLCAALVAGQALWGYHWINWYYLGCAVLIPTLIGHSMFHYAVKYVSVFYVNLAVLAEPVIAIVVMLAFSERFEVFRASELTTLQAIGGALLLLGVGFGLAAARRNQGVGNDPSDKSSGGAGVDGSGVELARGHGTGKAATAKP